MRISTDGQKNSIRITNDQSQYWADISKGFAEDAEQSALEARGYADAASASVVEANNIVKDFDVHVVTKTDEFDEHTVVKQGEFDTFAAKKQNDFDVNSANVTARFDNNYLDKTKDFNTNATNKTSAFDSNATLKTNAFNNNATAKTAIIDSKIEQAELAETNANIWAEGTDTQVRSLGGEHSAKGWNGIVSQTATAGVSSINNSTKDGVDLLNRTATNIAKEKYNNSAKGYLTGEVSTDEIMVNQLVDMKHSTFDKSKFTVVGSPTITDDGVVSGFNKESYIKASSNIDLTNVNNLKIEGSFVIKGRPIPDNGGRSQCVLHLAKLGIGNDDPIKLLVNYADSRSCCIVYPTSPNGIALTSWQPIEWGKINKFDIVLEQSSLRFTLNGINTVVDNVQESWWKHSRELWLGNSANDFQWEYINGSIDLKQFSISVDGKEVFNGNKTDLDVIKPDNFTKVGNPVISRDGIASGFSDSDYLKSLTTFNLTGKHFKFKIPFKLNSIQQNKCILKFMNASSFGWWNYIICSSYYLAAPLEFIDGTKTTLKMNLSAEYKLNEGYFAIFEWTGEKYILQLLKDGKLIQEASLASTQELSGRESTLLRFGYDDVGSHYNFSNGSIDLNAFKIYVDGNLVYQPLLRIPYTQSSTGSKIVDSAYRDRVEDVYQQYGNALYYTLGETNKDCTLPKGELYGFIDTKRLISSTRNKESFIEKYSDGTIIQGGKCTANILVNLQAPYKDNNDYNLTVGYSAKTKTSFTPTVTGDWIAYGKGEL